MRIVQLNDKWRWASSSSASLHTRATLLVIGAGIHHWLAPEKQVQFVEMGANLLIHKADAIFLSEGLRDEVSQIRGLLGQESGPNHAGSVNI